MMGIRADTVTTPHTPVNFTHLCLLDLDLKSYNHLFVDTHDVWFYLFVLPVITVLGLIGNLVSFATYHHKDMRGLTTMFLNALLLFDSMYLVSACLYYSPKEYLSYKYTVRDCAENEPYFWADIDWAQRLFVTALPITEMSQCLVVWYTLALVFEQYCVLHQPIPLSRWSNRDGGIKIIITILNVTVLVHLIHFFKYVRKDQLYHRVEHKNICLSDIYHSSEWLSYDTTVYFVIVLQLPWWLTLYFFIKVVIELRYRRRERLANYKEKYAPDLTLIRIFKGGRSHRVIIAITVVGMVCKLINDVIYAVVLTLPPDHNKAGDIFSNACHLIPRDRRFNKYDDVSEKLLVVFVFFRAFYSSVKFVLCYMVSYDFKTIVNRFFVRQFRRMKQLCAIFLLCDFRRRDIPEGGWDEDCDPVRVRTISEGTELSAVSHTSAQGRYMASGPDRRAHYPGKLPQRY